MSEPLTSPPHVLLVADADRLGELEVALAEPIQLPGGGALAVARLASQGGDDTVELFEAYKPHVVVVTATLVTGDARALIDALRGMVPRAHVAFVVIGDDQGPIRTAVDAMELSADRFVSRPLSAKALRYAIGGLVEQVGLARGVTSAVAAARTTTSPIAAIDPAAPQAELAEPDTRAALRARWEAIADSMVERLEPDDGEARANDEDDAPEVEDDAILEAADSGPALVVAPARREDDFSDLSEAPGGANLEPPPPPLIIKPRRRTEAERDLYEVRPSRTRTPEELPLAPVREPTLILGEPEAAAARAIPLTRAATIPPIPPAPSRVRTANGIAPPPPVRAASGPIAIIPVEPVHRLDPNARIDRIETVPPGLELTPIPPDDFGSLVVNERGADESWSEPVLLSEIEERERDSDRQLRARASRASDHDFDPTRERAYPPPDLGGISTTDELERIADFDADDLLADVDAFARDAASAGTGTAHLDVLGDLEPHVHQPRPRARTATPAPATPPPRAFGADPMIAEAPELAERADVDAAAPADVPIDGSGDFARQLRAKMSQMAQRLFARAPADGAPARDAPVDVGPRHDHHTEIDLAALAEEPLLGDRGVTEIESRALRIPADAREVSTSPGTWDTQVRERGLPDTGEIVRGHSDAAMLLAKTFATQTTCHVAFRRGTLEKIVFFDLGRPVFATSNDPADRMGELLVREGKITAAQYERCQRVVAESGRRMGEILVDFGYLKRRELLPAVRRHVEDIVYSLFGWDGGHYRVVPDPVPSAERIRLSRHPAALVLEGIRRKYDRSVLERLVGPPSTILEVPDRERLGGIINLSDLSIEERGALAAVDGQTDLAAVARVAGVDVADLLPLAWGLCVLGLATARRTDTEVPDESTALVGETDLAIDRERVRARWQLVSEADYFALLGVRRDATAFEIRRAYQAARRDFASDCFPLDLRRELARELDDIASVLDEAFRVLRDDRLRLTYLSNLFDQ